MSLRAGRPITMLDAAIVGLGWWGKKIVETLGGSTKLRLVKAVDTDPKAAVWGLSLIHISWVRPACIPQLPQAGRSMSGACTVSHFDFAAPHRGAAQMCIRDSTRMVLP